MSQHGGDMRGSRQGHSGLWLTAHHEVRQPLQALFLFARALRKADGPSPETLDYIDLALNGLQAKVDILTDLARLNAGHITADLQTHELRDILDRAKHTCLALAEKFSKTVTWRPIVDVRVLTDVPRITTLLQSMLLLAVKFATGPIEIAGRVRGPAAVIEASFPGPSLKDVDHSQAFVQATAPGSRVDHELGYGIDFMARLADLMDHRFLCQRLEGDQNRLAVILRIA